MIPIRDKYKSDPMYIHDQFYNPNKRVPNYPQAKPVHYAQKQR